MTTASKSTARGEQLRALRKLQLPTVDGVLPGVLKAILRCIDDHGNECWASNSTIAIETNFNSRTVRRALAALLHLDCLIAEKRRGQTSTYRINWERLYLGLSVPGEGNLGQGDLGLLVHNLGQGVPGPRTGSPQPRTGSPPKRNKRQGTEKKRHTKACVFVEPVLSEVQSFWNTSSLKGSADEFFDYYTANGWTQGRQSKRMKNWEAAARNWSRRHDQFAARASYGNKRSANVGPGVRFQATKERDPNLGKF